jgi:hypothetical protein
MTSPTTDDLEKTCRNLATRLGRAWAPDDRFGGVLLTFKRDEKDVLATVTQLLGTPWTAATLPTAPPPVREQVGRCGGLDAGQQFFYLAGRNGTALFGALWPWGNGVTVSLRVGLVTDGADASQRHATAARFLSWFGLASSK